MTNKKTKAKPKTSVETHTDDGLNLSSFMSEDDDITPEEFDYTDNNKPEDFEKSIEAKKIESEIAFERFQKEEFLIEISYTKEKRDFHKSRRNLALAIYSRIIAEANFIAFHESTKEKDYFSNSSKSIRELIEDLQYTTEHAEDLKKAAGVGLSKIAEAKFLVTDTHYLEENKKNKHSVDAKDLIAQFEELVNLAETLKF